MRAWKWSAICPAWGRSHDGDSLAWQRLRVRYALGAALIVASAATITASRFAFGWQVQDTSSGPNVISGGAA